MTKQITMDDIAAELNVSKSLISRALADKYGVSDEMRNKIKTTAIIMGYDFRGGTKNLNKEAMSVTIMIARHVLVDNGFWVAIINGIEKALYKKNISVFLSAIEDTDETQTPLSIKQIKTNGVLILGQMSMRHIVDVGVSGLPIVLVDSNYSELKFDQIFAHNYQGTYEATELLIHNGHKKIGFVGSALYSYSFQERHRGFAECMRKYAQIKEGVEIFDITNQCDEFSVPFSRKQFRSHMKNSNHPTALMCANDVTAFEVYNELNGLGLRIPEDVSVMGFDNLPKCDWVTPALTTVNIPKAAMGERAVDVLLNRIEQPESACEQLLIGTTIKVRDSVLSLERKK